MAPVAKSQKVILLFTQAVTVIYTSKCKFSCDITFCGTHFFLMLVETVQHFGLCMMEKVKHCVSVLFYVYMVFKKTWNLQMQPGNTELLRSDTELSCMWRQAGVGTRKPSTKALKSKRAQATNMQSSKQEKLETRRQVQKHINVIARGGKRTKTRSLN